MKLSIQAGSTSQTVNIFIQDSSSTTGAGLTGVAYNTSGFTAYYALPKAASVSITLATLAAVTTAWTSGGFKEIDSTNMPGWYRLDLPDAAIASGRFVSLHLKGVTNMAPLPIEIELTAWNNQDAVRGGMTALPNANAAAASGLPVLGANATAISFTAGLTISNAGGDALTLTSSGSNGNAVNASGNGSGAGIKATAGATGNGIQAVGGATSGSAIKATGTAGNAIALELAGQGSAAALSATGGATGAGAKFIGGGTSGDGIDVSTTSGDGIAITPTAGNGIVATANGTSKHGAVITGGTAGTSDGVKCVAGTGGVDLRAAITGNVTGNLSGSAGSVTGAVGSVTGAVGSVTGAVGSVTGNVGGNVVGSVASVTAAVTVSGDLSATMKTSVQTAADAAVTANTLVNAISGYIDTEVAAIKAKTDNLPASPAAVGSAMTLTSAYDYAKGTVAMTESYAANAAAPTPVQAMFALHQMMMQFAISSTSYTVKKLDNSTTAFVVTLDDAVNPTSAVRT